MKTKEELKNAIKANFEKYDFETAYDVNKNAELFTQYREVAGTRSLAAVISYYRKKAEAAKVEVVEEEPIQVAEPTEEEVATEVVTEVEEQTPTEQVTEEVVTEEASEEPTEEVYEQPTEEVEKKKEEEEYKFDMYDNFSHAEIESLLESGNKALNRYCIIKEYFKQESDTERIISTSMYVQDDGLGWGSFAEVTEKLGGKKGITKRVAGSFWKSNCGLPVGEEITKMTVYKVEDALRKFAFRNNSSAVLYASSLIF